MDLLDCVLHLPPLRLTARPRLVTRPASFHTTYAAVSADHASMVQCGVIPTRVESVEYVIVAATVSRLMR